MSEMTEDDLVSLVEHYITDSLGYAGDELSQERETALDYYFGRPFGNEQDGLSKVVSRDVADTVEWILPSLLRIFIGGEDVVRFDPVGQEDEAQAEQETAVTNYVIQSQNPGFTIFHDWFKDALLSKTGTVTWCWDKSEKLKFERYTNLTDDEYTGIVGQGEIEVVEHEERLEPVDDAVLANSRAQAQAAGIDPSMVPTEATVHDVLIKRTDKQSKLRISNVAPEESLIHKDARDRETGLFSAHMCRMTISDLREMGYDDDILGKLSLSDTGMPSKGTEEVARDEYAESDASDRTIIDEATRRVWVFYCTVRVDFDGDGYAELRRIVYCQGHVLENDYTDAVRYADICPIRTPHRFVGQSVADLVMDLQRIKSELWRQALNNLYLANNPQKGIISGQVEIEDLLRPRIGGLVRMTRPDAVTPIVTTDMSASALQMMEYTDTVRENRTGVTRYNQGLHTDTLNKTKGGIEQILGQAQQRIELIARIFAETGVKKLMQGIHDDLVRNQRKDIAIKLKNNWVKVNPSSWRERSDLTVHVGIGTGNKEENVKNLMMLQQLQFAALQTGFATPENLYYNSKKLAESMGRKDAEQLFTDPRILAQIKAQQPPPPNPIEIEARVKMAQAQIKAATDEKTTAVKVMADKEHNGAQLQLEAQKLAIQQQEQTSKERIELAWIQSEEKKHREQLDAELRQAIELERIRQQHEDARHAQTMQRQKESDEAMKGALTDD